MARGPLRVKEQKMKQALRDLPLGAESLRQLREQCKLLVDKTAQLAELAQGSTLFLARPNGFGKTLLLSTLQELFAHGASDNPAFAGLAVQARWPHGTFPMVRLSLAGLTNPNMLSADLAARLCTAFEAAGFAEAAALRAQGLSLTETLGELEVMTHGTDLVVLIDDWDFPLSAQLHNRAAFEANSKVLRQLAAWLRELPNLWFTLLTGVTCHQSSTIWGGCDIRDLTWEPAYADLLGYTKDELKTYFADYLEVAAERLHLGTKELCFELERHYGGFCFERNAQVKLFCPLFINRFFAQVVGPDHTATIPTFGDYRQNHA